MEKEKHIELHKCNNKNMNVLQRLYLTEDGIAELLDEITIYYEGFSSSKDVRIGEVEKKLFKCRCYCDFKGVPVKRGNVKIYSNIEPLSKKYAVMFDLYYIKTHEEFLKAKKKNTEFTRQVFLEYQIDSTVYIKLTEVFEDLKSTLLEKGTFTWSDFVYEITISSLGFKPEDFLKYGRSFRDFNGMHKIKFRLDSLNYKVEDKSTIFSNIHLF